MKILQINSVCGIGSTGRIATDLHASYEEAGFESYIAYGRGESLNCDKDATIKIGTKFDNYTHVLKTRALDQHGLGSKNATIEFIKKVEKIDPDVIHLHNIHGYYINIQILFDYLKKTNKPVIWTLHDCWSFTGHCVHFEYKGCECWKPHGNHHCIQKKSYPTSWLVNNSKNNYKIKKNSFTGLRNLTIVTPSKWLAKLVKMSFLKEYPVKVINNGINVDVFKPVKTDFKKQKNLNNRFMILGVANSWDEKKGYDYFIELSKYIKPKEMIVLVGLNKKQLRRLPDNILGISKTNSIQELVNLYSAADVFVNPTLEDNFPTVNIESIACGTPVITFDTGGSSEIINKKNGILLKDKTVNSILEAIIELKNSPNNIKNNRQKNKMFSKEKMNRKYIQLLNEVLKD